MGKTEPTITVKAQNFKAPTTLNEVSSPVNPHASTPRS